jgi:hypothetical protein
MAIRWEIFWIVLYLAVFSIILYRSLLFSSFHAFAVFTVVYIAYYLVAYSGDGRRSWHWLRSLSLWDVLRPYQIYCASFEEFRQDQKYLFIVLYNLETDHSRLHMEWRMSIWAFSLYGKKLPFFSLARPIVCLPDRVFKVPYLTEVLQWLGCISIRHAQDTWERPDTSIVLPVGQGDIIIEKDTSEDLWMVIVRHDPEARCTIIGEPFLYQNGDMHARIEAVSRMMPVNPYSD